MAHQWSPRVTARAELATILKQEYADVARNAGLKVSDLDALIEQGEVARLADLEQKEQLAIVTTNRSERKDQAADVFNREEALRSRIPAVIAHLNSSGHRQLGGFLSALSFARFRFRELAPPPPDPNAPPAAEAEEVKLVARVAREDIPTRARGLAAFCRAVSKPGREPIVAELAERGVSADWLATLAADAEAIERAGRNVIKGVEATTRETDAVAAQSKTWQEVRRMIRTAVKGIAALESKFAAC
jgi:hypothetical protein